MNLFQPPVRSAIVLTAFALVFAARAKPPVPSKDEKKPSPAPAKVSVADETGSASFLRWLLLQNAGPDAICVGWPELIQVTAGKQIVPLDPANSTDSAMVTKFGTALDSILPRLNRLDGAVRSRALLTSTEIAARIADELRTALSATPAMTVVNLSFPAPYEPMYPTHCCTDTTSGKTYYLSVVLYPTGGRDGALRALTFRASESARRITADGCCLLVAIEDNGLGGADLTLLNWELIDLAKVSVRCAVNFEADENALHQPGATVTDGRKGRD